MLMTFAGQWVNHAGCSLFLDKIQHLCTGKPCCSQVDGDVLSLSYNHGKLPFLYIMGYRKNCMPRRELMIRAFKQCWGSSSDHPWGQWQIAKLHCKPRRSWGVSGNKAGGHHLCLKLPWVTIEGTLSTMISFNADWHCHWSCHAKFLFSRGFWAKQGEVDR